MTSVRDNALCITDHLYRELNEYTWISLTKSQQYGFFIFPLLLAYTVEDVIEMPVHNIPNCIKEVTWLRYV